MGKVLQQALTALARLSEVEQEAAGAWILAELESERRWDASFAKSANICAEISTDEATPTKAWK